jgi:hypothetical protein
MVRERQNIVFREKYCKPDAGRTVAFICGQAPKVKPRDQWGLGDNAGGARGTSAYVVVRRANPQERPKFLKASIRQPAQESAATEVFESVLDSATSPHQQALAGSPRGAGIPLGRWGCRFSALN